MTCASWRRRTSEENVIHAARSILVVGAVVLNPCNANAAGPEFLCLKDHAKPLVGYVIACYSDSGCNVVQSRGAEPVRNYDKASVAAALGREKIEGIVTDSTAIMKTIRGYGYACREIGN
jgi:Asp/Glu/hydantoin racemase